MQHLPTVQIISALEPWRIRCLQRAICCLQSFACQLKVYRLLLLSDRTVRMVPLQDNKSLHRPNCLFPAILRICRFIHNEAMGVLYGENVFRAHRIDDMNDNAASIKRAKFLIGIVTPDDAEDDASKLPKFLKNHANLEHLVLDFGSKLLEKSELRDDISNMLFTSFYSFRLTVRSAFQSKRSAYNAARLERTVDAMAFMRKSFPKEFKIFVDKIMSREHARELVNL